MAPKWTLVEPQILVFANMKWPVQHILFGASNLNSSWTTPLHFLAHQTLTAFSSEVAHGQSGQTLWRDQGTKLQQYSHHPHFSSSHLYSLNQNILGGVVGPESRLMLCEHWVLLEKAIQLVEHNALHDLGYNWQDRDGSIVFHLCFITILQNWGDICTLPF